MKDLSLIAVMVLGASGGLLNHLYFHGNALLLPRVTGPRGQRQLALGFLADMALGVGGALVGIFLLIGTDVSMARQAVVALLSGFSGGTLLARNAAELEGERNRLKNEIKRDSPVRDVNDALRRVNRASSIQELHQIRGQLGPKGEFRGPGSDA